MSPERSTALHVPVLEGNGRRGASPGPRSAAGAVGQLHRERAVLQALQQAQAVRAAAGGQQANQKETGRWWSSWQWSVGEYGNVNGSRSSPAPQACDGNTRLSHSSKRVPVDAGDDASVMAG